MLLCKQLGKGIELCDPQTIKLQFGLDEDCIVIPVYDNTKEDIQKREKFNRAKRKRELQNIIDEGLDEYYYGDSDDYYK